VTARDTLGAGDAFHGALAASVAARAADLAGCVALAAEVASARCARLGARGWLQEPVLAAARARLSTPRARR
jgi:sugar/nucleoside kinase (ribokinase family)